MAVKKKAALAEKKEEVFTFEQLLAAERFRNRRDVLRAVLSDRKKYSISDVEKKIEGFMKGKVK
ncbi:MAG: hypothetical protein HDR24_00385 [Lachnospiraceae bacterium]|nr:hypothetical protein [Lachnospiraceae bacterium]